jgi:hypothetical protein
MSELDPRIPAQGAQYPRAQAAVADLDLGPRARQRRDEDREVGLDRPRAALAVGPRGVVPAVGDRHRQGAHGPVRQPPYPKPPQMRQPWPPAGGGVAFVRPPPVRHGPGVERVPAAPLGLDRRFPDGDDEHGGPGAEAGEDQHEDQQDDEAHDSMIAGVRRSRGGSLRAG